jgi:preprotein translocase subunit SecE
MPQVTTSKQKKTRFAFISEIIAELKKVVWLSRRELTYLTAIVLLVIIAAAIVLGAIDFGFTKLIDIVFLGR